MNNTEILFKRLSKLLKEVSKIEYALFLAQWDQDALMPRGGGQGRAEIIASLSERLMELFTAAEIGDILEELATRKSSLSAEKIVLIEKLRRSHKRAGSVPLYFWRQLGKVESQTQNAWVKAKSKSDFHLFRPHLERVFRMTRELADFYGYKSNPYDAILSEFEPGLTVSEFKKIINPLRKKLVPFIRQILNQPNQPNKMILRGNFSIEQQKDFSRRVLERMGFDFSKGKIDATSTHPMTTMVGPRDIRITTIFSSKRADVGLFNSIHEGGHGLFDQGIDSLLRWIPCEIEMSMGLHESQSLIWEYLIGKNLPFWKFLYPEFQAAFPHYSDISLDDFYRAINIVEATPIRYEADEVTYNLHVMLRFEIEDMLLNDKIRVADLPDVWNQKMEEYLGIIPPDDAHGVLQDIHWSTGCIGYFPSYLIGNLCAAQLYQKAKRQIGDLEKEIAGGNLRIFLTWLRENVHQWGQIYEAQALMKKVTGKPISADGWWKYITKKYSQIYGL